MSPNSFESFANSVLTIPTLALCGVLLVTDEAAKSAVKAYRFVRPENFEETEQADNAKLSAVGGTAVRRCTTNAQAFERNGKQEECAVVKLRSSILMPDLPPKSPK